MKIASLTDDRRKLIKALEKATGLKAKYLGAPSFSYEIGPYTVDRTGELIVSDEEVDKEILQELITKELVFNPESAEQEATIISLPITDHDGRSLKNLVNMIHSRSVLLSKAVGRLGQFKVSEELVTSLDGQTPQTVEDFLQILEAAGEGALQGLSFESGKIGFIFPQTIEPEKIHTYMKLAELMAKMARSQHRVQAAKCKDTNEKYTFRVWLMRLGMMGDEYKTARRILLKNLKGHAAYRTKSQAEVAKEKLKLKREAERKAADELAFEEM